jgi:beta-glucosidase
MSSLTEAVNGIQGEGVISTLKHYTLNCNETNRHWLDAIIDPDVHCESDLLAFYIAIERSQPSSIMFGYNTINGEYASGKVTTCSTRCSKTLGATEAG